VVASEGDSVKLPQAAENLRVIIPNRGANFAALFPSNGDNIDDNAIDASVTISPNGTISLLGIDNTTWVQI